MNKFNIGFIGGCLNNQIGIGRNEAYYSVLTRLITQSELNSEQQISLGRYHSYDQLVHDTENFITKKRPEILFIFIRPFPLMSLQKPIIKYDKENGTTGRALHPGLFTRKTEWEAKLTKHQRTEPDRLITRPGFALRDINLAAGILLGLHHWALRYLTEQIESIRLLCKEEKIRFTVISPPKNPESIMANLICKRTAKYLRAYCHKNDVGFVDINGLSSEYFEKDNIHFNLQGHERLGKILYSKIVSQRSLPDHRTVVSA